MDPKAVEIERHFETARDVEAFRTACTQDLVQPVPAQPLTFAQLIRAKLMERRYQLSVSTRGLNVLSPEGQLAYLRADAQDDLIRELLTPGDLLGCKGELDGAIERLKKRDKG
jgi:hypothetical protein